MFIKNHEASYYLINSEDEMLGFKTSIFVFNWLLSERFALGNSESEGSKNGKSKCHHFR